MNLILLILGLALAKGSSRGSTLRITSCSIADSESGQSLVVKASNGESFSHKFGAGRTKSYTFSSRVNSIKFSKTGSDGLCIETLTLDGVDLKEKEGKRIWFDEPCEKASAYGSGKCIGKTFSWEATGYSNQGSGKCQYRYGGGARNEFLAEVGLSGCESACDERSDCYGFSVSDPHCLLWLECELVGGGSSWGDDTECFIKNNRPLVCPVVPTEPAVDPKRKCEFVPIPETECPDLRNLGPGSLKRCGLNTKDGDLCNGRYIQRVRNCRRFFDVFRYTCEQKDDKWENGVLEYHVNTKGKDYEYLLSEPGQAGSIEACKARCDMEDDCKSIVWDTSLDRTRCWLTPLSQAEAKQKKEWRYGKNKIHYDKKIKCTATQVPNSGNSKAGSITGYRGDKVSVKCNTGYRGGGVATCGSNGLFNSLKCVVQFKCYNMRRYKGCSTKGEFTAGRASNARQCGKVCAALSRSGCCEWQVDHKRCVFQPNDRWTSSTSRMRYAAMCYRSKAEESVSLFEESPETPQAYSVMFSSSFAQSTEFILAAIGALVLIYGAFKLSCHKNTYNPVKNHAEI